MIEEEIEEIMDEDEKSYTGAVLPYAQFEEVLLNFFRDASICAAINDFDSYFFDVQCEVYLASAICVITRIGLFRDGGGSYLSIDADLPTFESTYFRNNNGATFTNVPFKYDVNVLMSYAAYEDTAYSCYVANYICSEILFKAGLLERDNLFRCVPGNVRYVQRKRVIHVQTL